MKRLVFQIVYMSICLLCSVMLTIGMFVYCIEHQGGLDYTHAVFGSLFTFVALLCERILFQCVQEYQELRDEEYQQHMLDVADDYASREY